MDDVVRVFLANGQQLRPIKRLGSGGFAEAGEVESPSGVRSAVKVSLQPINGKNLALKKEPNNLSLIKAIPGHPHIVSLLDYWVVMGSDRLPRVALGTGHGRRPNGVVDASFLAYSL
ncbi:hypothetical protein [Thermopirellula anaerolimosa]